jgi:hypothetical protein
MMINCDPTGKDIKGKDPKREDPNIKDPKGLLARLDGWFARPPCLIGYWMARKTFRVWMVGA